MDTSAKDTLLSFFDLSETRLYIVLGLIAALVLIALIQAFCTILKTSRKSKNTKVNYFIPIALLSYQVTKFLALTLHVCSVLYVAHIILVKEFDSYTINNVFLFNCIILFKAGLRNTRRMAHISTAATPTLLSAL